MGDGDKHRSHKQERQSDLLIHPPHKTEGRDERHQYDGKREKHTSYRPETGIEKGQHDYNAQNKKNLHIRSHLMLHVVS